MAHDKYDISDPVHLAEIEDHGIVAISRRRDKSLTAGLLGSAIAAGCEIRTDRNFVGPLRSREIMSTRCEICEVYLSDTLYPNIIQWAEDRALWFEGRRFRYAYDRENFERGIAYGYAKPAEARSSSATNH